MQAQAKCYKKLYHKFFVYLPVFILSSLIILVYASYVFTYIIILTNVKTPEGITNPQVPITDSVYAFNHTSSVEYARKKGVALFIFITFCFIMLGISFVRTIFMDPGYFPSPAELEYKIVLKNTKHQPKNRKKKSQNLNSDKTTDEISSHPYQNLKENNSFLTMEKDDERYKFLSEFSDIIEEGPLTFNEVVGLRSEITKQLAGDGEASGSNEHKYLSISKDTKDDNLVKNEVNDQFEKFKGIDFSKAILCGTCLRWKIERSHHCRQCGRCVLKMDHHCPWLANCIGFKNYKFFCLIHFYGVLASLTIACTYWEVLVNDNMNYNTYLIEVFFCFFVYVANFGLFSFLLWLFYSNWTLVFTGQTVVEHSDRERFPSKSINIYNLGYYKNFITVFGKNPLVWFLPFFPNYEGDGIVFETNLEKLKNSK